MLNLFYYFFNAKSCLEDIYLRKRTEGLKALQYNAISHDLRNDNFKMKMCDNFLIFQM